jgi:hypothetical protein
MRQDQGRLAFIANAALMAVGSPVPSDPPEGLEKWFKGSVARRLFEAEEAGLLTPDLDQWFTAESNRMAARGKQRQAIDCRRAAEAIVKVKIPPPEVSAMLETAHAPTSVNPEAPAELSGECLVQALGRERRLRYFDFEKRKAGWRRAGKAAGTLKPLLREIIRETEYTDQIRHDVPPQAPKYRAALDALEVLQFRPPAIADLNPGWKSSALALAKAYVELVAPEAGWSADGPAVKFLALALNRIYYPEKPGSEYITRAAIRTRLQRDLRK